MTYGALMRFHVITRFPERRSFLRASAAVSIVACLGIALVMPGQSAQAVAPRAEVPAGLEAFYGQALEWSTCSSDLVCAWLTVPLDYANPGGRTIRLRVSKARATGPSEDRQGSLVVNPGGPGAPALDFAQSVASSIAPTVAKAFDVIGFDPRGVGESVPVICLTGPQTTRWLEADQSPDTASEERRLMALASSFARGCLQRSPMIATHLGTDDTIRDMDILRQALGDDSLNFLGFSYGTYLGALYAQQFPDRVGRFVLDGALDPSLDLMEISKGQSVGFQVAVSRFASYCSRRSNCPYSGDQAAVLRGMNRLLMRLEIMPMRTGTARKLHQSEAVTAIFTSLYSKSFWPSLRSALAQAARGDGSGLLDIFDYANDRTGPNTYAGNLTSAFIAISCWDLPATPGAQGLGAAADAWSKGAAVPVMASTMAWGNAPCSQWYGHSPRVPAPISTTTTAPVLIVGTTFDPATPYAWAVSLSKQMPTSTLLTFRGDGHTAYGSGSDCISRAVDAYLLSGQQPAAGTVCR
ncbi:MAG: alpha/beta fold hydrolase [Actinobacteria bacterium]|uniref:Unannotated protein n=1 Tax=freshwater metagenome TaxID=449393 RepID=A0A6J7CVE6_9ZZZZ|nr:alpha/beta fold hydrolase [Actinomycetota bacterium]